MNYALDQQAQVDGAATSTTNNNVVMYWAMPAYQSFYI